MYLYFPKELQNNDMNRCHSSEMLAACSGIKGEIHCN